MKIIVYAGADGQWYWKGVAKNGANICNGSEGYATMANARRAARRTKFLMAFAPILVLFDIEARVA